MRASITSFQRWHLDKPLIVMLALLCCLSLILLYSASGQKMSVILAQSARLAFGFGVLFLVAQIHPDKLTRWTPYIFITGIVLLIIVLGIGAASKGAQRWLNLGFIKFQPSEIAKLGVPMMVAWYLSKRELPPRIKHIVLAAILILVPTMLVAAQPDLGTALMIASSGLIVLFLAGISWHWIIGLLVLAGSFVPLVWTYYMHDYQKQRVLTLLDPESDPLGTGYHTIQSIIAVGSGGIFGKGWLNGSQARLDFLPERSTDFIFAVYAEEFGFFGVLLLLTLYFALFSRGMWIAFHAQDTYARLLAASLSLTFFLYFFVNVGMVTGILPVVGVPLPIVSYGGSSIVTLMAAFGIITSIHTHRKIVQT